MLEIIVVIIAIFLLIPLLPAKYIFIPDYYFDNKGKRIQRGKVSLSHLFLHQIVVLLQETLVGVAVALGLRGAVTILIFLVAGADLYYRKGLSSQGLIISVVGVIALYLDQLVESASELDFLKGLFHYKRK